LANVEHGFFANNNDRRALNVRSPDPPHETAARPICWEYIARVYFGFPVHAFVAALGLRDEGGRDALLRDPALRTRVKIREG
jgi:hypothetical protein